VVGKNACLTQNLGPFLPPRRFNTGPIDARTERR
jgi:hypothetical protein